MKHKTAVRLAVRLIGLIFILAQVPWLVAMLFEFFSQTFLPFGATSSVIMFGWPQLIASSLICAFAIYLFLGGSHVVNFLVPSNRPYCPECGYELSAITQDGICPECGTEFVRQARAVGLSLRQRWGHLVRRLNRLADPQRIDAEYDALEAAYGSPAPRAYHNLLHVANCLATLDRQGLPQAATDAVEFALWFHDADYVAGATNNEARSAERAREAALRLELGATIADQMAKLVLATRHVDPPSTPQEALIVDVDLAGLGMAPEQYFRYGAAIRAEFQHVSQAEFDAGRIAFLKGMLGRPTIYFTERMRVACEASARRNLADELERLTKSSAA